MKYIKLSSIKLNPNNPRRIKGDNFKSLVESIKRDPEYLEKRGIVVADGIILGGNQRYLAIEEALKDEAFRKSLGLEKDMIPASWVVDASEWSEEKRRRFIIVDNGMWGEWDFDILANEWSDMPLNDLGVDLPDDWLKLNVDIDDEEDIEEQINRAEELNKKWKVKAGDLYIIGNHRLICGDCTDKVVMDKLMQGEKADTVLTDPPYGISVVKNGTIGGGGPVGGIKNFKASIGGDNIVKANQYAPIYGDDKPFDPIHLLDLSDNLIIFGGNYFANKLPNTRGWLVWDKIDGMEGTTKNFSDFEMAWTSFDRPARIFRHRWQGLMKGSERDEKRCHPTQKPIKLFEDILDYYADGLIIILDPYIGSGTTMIACEKTGRKCRGVEISPEYCAVILQRMSDAFPDIKIEKANDRKS